MSDLRSALDQLRQAIDDLPSSATAAQIAPLEDEARQLLTQSKNTPLEAEARELFSQLARLSSPASANAENPELRSILRRARIRIDIAGDDHDYDEVIDILAQALDLAPDQAEIHELLHQAAQQSEQHRMKVQGLLDRYGIALDLTPEPSTPSASAISFDDDLDDPETLPTPEYPTEPAPNQPIINQPRINPAAAELLSQISNAYYAGDYSQTVDLADRLLAIDPNNPQALDYRQKADDNLLRGVVPDHRIPFDARVSYNRANSLVRAGNYDEAERLYREARDIADRAGIPSWKDVEQALLEIQDLVLARQLIQEGDRHLAADDWSAAQSKYDGALRVVPNDPEAEERLELVRAVRQQYDQANAQMGAISGSLTDRAAMLTEILNALAVIRQTLPGSDRLKQAVGEVNSRLGNIKAQLLSQGEGALLRLDNATSVEEKLRLANEAQDMLEIAADIDPSDTKVQQALQQAQQFGATLGGGRQVMERAANFIAQNTDNEIAQARQMLASLSGQAQDPRYRLLVGELLNRYIQRVEMALDDKDLSMAERWLAFTKEEPFRMLGRRTEVLKLEEEIRNIKQKKSIRNGMLIALVVGLLAFGLLVSRSAWQPTLFPPPTETPLPTATFTPSTTPTVTSTPTLTSTPSLTPTNSPVPDDQTATMAVTQTQIAATQQSIFALTATVQARNEAITATVRYLDDQATIAANETAIQGTSIARTLEAQQNQSAFMTQTATAWTATPTDAPSSTPTLTPSATPPQYLCRVFNNSGGRLNVRSEPSVNSIGISFLDANRSANVLQQRIGSTNPNQIWYRISFTVGGSMVEGWILSDLVVEFDECPPLN